MTAAIRVALPTHLRNLARIEGEVHVTHEELQGIDGIGDGKPTLGAVLGAIEARYPMLQGAIRDHNTHKRRAFVRFFACEEDLSHEPQDMPLPDRVTSGEEPLLVVGAMAGG